MDNLKTISGPKIAIKDLKKNTQISVFLNKNKNLTKVFRLFTKNLRFFHFF